MTDQPDENTTIRFLQDIPDGSFKKGEILTYTEEKAAAAVKNVESRYGKNYVEYIGKNVSVPTVPAVLWGSMPSSWMR